jgi:tRNA 2-thiocytidine biosynthesis protein TtcA
MRPSRLARKIQQAMSKAIHDFDMIKKGDRVLVCLSGGKDSFAMTHVLQRMWVESNRRFDLKVFTLDQGQPGWCDNQLKAWLTSHQLPYEILSEDTYTIVKDKIPEHKTYCGLCSRLRRGIIYRYAREHGFNKIALGHHRDDLIVTLLMSILYNGQIQSMPPKLLSDDKKNVVVRPMSYCQESDLTAYAKEQSFPIIPCNLCGSQTHLKRAKVKKLIDFLAQENPQIPSNMLHALSSVNPSQLMDKTLWDFHGLEEAFTEDEVPCASVLEE